MIELEKLKKLVLDGSYDEESKKEVKDLEDRLHKMLVAEKLVEHPVILEYTTHLTDEIRRCSYLLLEDRSMSEVDRQAIFKYRDILERFTQMFNGAEKSEIESKIKDLLNVAKD